MIIVQLYYAFGISLSEPAAPTNVKVYAIATDRLFVSWSAPDIVPKEFKYRIRVRQVDVGDGDCTLTSTDTKPASSWPLTGAELQESHYVVSALKAGACYEVGVVTIEGSLSSEEKKEALRTLINGLSFVLLCSATDAVL